MVRWWPYFWFESSLSYLDFVFILHKKGLVNLFNINRDLAANNLVQKHSFKGLHKFHGETVAPCTDLSVCGHSVATVGEDGRFVQIITTESGTTDQSNFPD